MASRGRLRRLGAGVPGRTPFVPQFVRFAGWAGAKAAGSAPPGFGPSMAASRSGSPATASPCTGPGCTQPRWASCGCAGRASCRRFHPASPCLREPDGRFYASFVVEREPTPLAPVARTVGIDLGLVWFATVAASDGTAEHVVNPRHLRTAQRRLARAQRQLACKRKGSANRAKARVRVAVAYRRVRDRRADRHHKLALRLIRENQVVALEDVVRGRAWTYPVGQERPRRWMGDLRPAAGGEGHPARASGRRDRPLGRPHLPDLFGMPAPGRPRSRPTSAPGSARPAGSFTTETSTRPAISWSPPGWRRPKTPVEPVSDRQ